jgi:hypothetical protein
MIGIIFLERQRKGFDIYVKIVDLIVPKQKLDYKFIIRIIINEIIQ